MKSILLFIFTILTSMTLFSQGITFEQTNWKEVLGKATQTGKPVFIDVYTTWCGPCKQMSAKIFPLEEVGTYYNQNFICYRFDAEKGEGIDLARQYEITAYPTYLFVKPCGELFYRSLGSMPASQFMKVGRDALKEVDNPANIGALGMEFSRNKTNPRIMHDYMNKRLELSMTNTALLEEYISILSPVQQTADSTLKFICLNNNSIQPGSNAYKLLTGNTAHIKEFGKNLIDRYDYVIRSVTNHKFYEAIDKKSEELLNEVIHQESEFLGDKYRLSPDQLWMQYYGATDNREKYMASAINYLDNTEMKLSLEGTQAKDAENYQNWRASLTAEDSATKDPEEWKAEVKNSMNYYSFQYANDLNNIAWNFFETEADIQSLLKALGWSKRALEFSNEEDAAFLDTYANLQYKLGNPESALTYENKAFSKCRESGQDCSDYEKTLEIMKKGEPTWGAPK